MTFSDVEWPVLTERLAIRSATRADGEATWRYRRAPSVAMWILKLRRLTANCFADNVASWRLMERVGMRRELHEVRGSLHRTEGWIDSLGYALLAEESRDVASKGSPSLRL